MANLVTRVGDKEGLPIRARDVAFELKDKNFSQVRKWVGEHSDTDTAALYREFYDNAAKYFQAHSVPQLVLILAKYQYQAAFVADHEINNTACLLEVMIDCEFK